MRLKIPGLAILGFIGAAGLLSALGYGIPVGVSVIVGLVLGLAGGLLGSLWLARGPGRSISVGPDMTTWSDGEPSSELFAEMQDVAALSGVDLGAVRRVLGLMQTAEASGIAMTLNVVEVREAGLHMSLEAEHGLGMPTPPVFGRVVVSDAAGTAYRGIMQLQNSAQNRSQYVLTATPAPQPVQEGLEVRVESLVDLFPGMRREIAGPWTFSVSLGRGPSPAG